MVNQLESCQKIIKAFSCTTPRTIGSPQEKTELQTALILYTQLSDTQNLGICADSQEQALSVLQKYLIGLGHPPITINPNDYPTINSPVYLKCNISKSTIHLDSYYDQYRGVLISCQSDHHDQINGTYGHFPLDLFD